MADQVYGMLGLAMKAGLVLSGTDVVLRSLNQAAFVLLDEDVADNTRKKIADACVRRGISLYLTESGRLGQALGKPSRMVAALKPGKLTDRLLEFVNAGLRPYVEE